MGGVSGEGRVIDFSFTPPALPHQGGARGRN